MQNQKRASDIAGKVWLVGAGPGDPDLLTMKAARLLANARLIVHDGLVSAEILALASPDARLISVAKRRARHTLPQDQINALMIAQARKGHDVVRLKGGDPFIFGRGGEEVDDLQAAGVAVEVVPGISAANGAAAQALLPLTHRDASSAVSFVAGQCKGLSDQDWSGLAGQNRTLVIYMGVATSEAIADKLIADGVAPDMPVAVLENGTRHDARALRTVLTDLGAMIAREKIKSPALLVVGEVVTRSTASDMFAAFARPVHAGARKTRPSTSSGLTELDGASTSSGLSELGEASTGSGLTESITYALQNR